MSLYTLNERPATYVPIVDPDGVDGGWVGFVGGKPVAERPRWLTFDGASNTPPDPPNFTWSEGYTLNLLQSHVSTIHGWGESLTLNSTPPTAGFLQLHATATRGDITVLTAPRRYLLHLSLHAKVLSGDLQYRITFIANPGGPITSRTIVRPGDGWFHAAVVVDAPGAELQLFVENLSTTSLVLSDIAFNAHAV